MSKVVINTQYVDFVSNSKQTEPTKGFRGEFAISSSLRNIGISEEDEVVIATPTEGLDLQFISQGKITKVNETKHLAPRNKSGVVPNSKQNYVHNFQLEIVDDLKHNNQLSELEYSIKSVYRFNKPLVHFRQQFREITYHDYETIINGWVYTTRTTFGKLINSLPRQNKLEFMLQAMDNFSTVDFRKIQLCDGLDFLYAYIERRILSRGKLLVETKKLIEAHLSEIIPKEEIGFANTEGSSTNNLFKQAQLFEQLFALQKDSNLISLFNKTLSENSILESRFLKIFKSETWPIDLSV